MQTGKLLREFTAPIQGRVIHADCSADGKFLLLVDDHRTAHFFDTASGKVTLSGKDSSVHPPWVAALAFAPGSRRVALILGNPSTDKNKHTLRICELATGKVICETNVPLTWIVAFALDGKLLLTTHLKPNATVIREAASGKQLQRIEPKASTPTPFAFSADGKQLLAFGGSGLMRWDVVTGKQLDPDPDPEPGRLLALSPDGKLLVTHRYPDEIRLLDAGNGKEVARLNGYGAAAFSPDGKLLARARKVDGRWHGVRFYDLSARKT